MEVNMSMELSIWRVCLRLGACRERRRAKTGRPEIHTALQSLAHVPLTFPVCSCGFSLSFPLHSFLCSAPGLRFGWGTWMDGSLLSDPRTQLPGETTMTPPLHTRQARQGPPAEDMPHRAETTAANKVSIHIDIYCVLYYVLFTYSISVYICYLIPN